MSRNNTNDQARRLHPALTPSVCLTALAVLVACGGGSSSDGGYTPQDVAIGVGDTSGPADDVATEVLQRNAARNAAASISVNLGGVQHIAEGSSSLTTTVAKAPVAGPFNDGMVAAAGDVAPVDVIGGADSDISRLLQSTLGIDESGNVNGTVTREGNLILIDPDDAAVCAGETYMVDDADSAADTAICREMVSHFMVQIDAQTEQSGQLTYLFDNAPLLSIGYGPLNAVFDLELGVLRNVMQLGAQLEGDDESVPALMQGALRLTSSVTDNRANNEKGSLSLAVTKALLIEDSADGSRISLAASRLFSVSSDEAAGTASLELSMGALDLLLPPGDDDAFPVNSMLRVAMNGLTGRMDLSNDGGMLVVSNLGFGNGPLSLSIDANNLLELSLRPFGFSFSESDGKLVMDSELDLGLILRMVSDGNLSMDFGLTAPQGTQLSPDAESNQLVNAGGPMNLTYSITSSGGQSENGFVTWNVGSCEDSSNQSAQSETDPDNTFLSMLNCSTGQ